MQIESIVRLCLDEHISFSLQVVGVTQFGGSMGVPEHVVGRAEQDALVFLFDSRYQDTMSIDLSPVGIEATLSFDTLYRCKIPWSCVRFVLIPGFSEVVWPTEWSKEAEVSEELAEGISSGKIVAFPRGRP